MHELSIMQSALEQALEEARRAGARSVREIRLRVGVLSGVVPEALTMAFGALIPGTLAEQAVLKIENVPAQFWCVTCDCEFISKTWDAECPKCRCTSRDLRAGRELELASLEVA